MLLMWQHTSYAFVENRDKHHDKKNASAFSLLLSNESKILKRIVKKINIVIPQNMKNDILHAEMYFMKLHN